MPLQQARRAFSIDSPLRMMLTPHNLFAKSTPQYWEPVGVVTVSSLKGRKPKPASTTCIHHIFQVVTSCLPATVRVPSTQHVEQHNNFLFVFCLQWQSMAVKQQQSCCACQAAGQTASWQAKIFHAVHDSKASYQSEKSVSNEDEVCLVSILIPQDCMHAPDLVI